MAAKSPEQIEQWAEDYILRLFDLAAELGIKILPMFWGVAFGWEVATGYPWGFWSGGDFDFIKEGKERFVKKTAKIRAQANKLGHLSRSRDSSRERRRCAPTTSTCWWRLAMGTSA